MKILITEKQLMILMEDSQSVLKQNSSNNMRLFNILLDIQNKTGKLFTQEHFSNEIELSGGIKKENGGFNENALKEFNNMKKACPGLYYDEDSYRTWERQAELFTDHIIKKGSIEDAMKLRAIPGFSQHHTGKAFDVKPSTIKKCVAKHAEEYGFIFPYNKNGVRVKEPWHIYYNK